MSLSYEKSGVRYDQLDAFKRACQKAARTTAGVLNDHGYAQPATTRGESAYLIEADDHFLAHVEEGLGTKNLVADAVYAATGKCYYREIAIDTVATIVNDLITCGALPISVAMHAAVGDSDWFADTTRANALVDGFAEGWGVDYRAVAEVEADVVDLDVGVAIEYEVSGFELALAESCCGEILGVRCAGQGDAGCGVGGGGEAGAVESGVAVLGFSELRKLILIVVVPASQYSPPSQSSNISRSSKAPAKASAPPALEAASAAVLAP